MDSKLSALERKISELEQELVIKDQDLIRYRSELTKANTRITDLLKQVNQELKMARQLHKILVPTEYKNIPGVDFSTRFIPGGIKGGDYFDIFEHEDKMRFGVLMASSSGYTMSSLLLQALLKMTGQLEARKGVAPQKIIDRIAAELSTSISAKDHASLFYAVIDRRTFELNFASAGQVFALHWDSVKNKYQKLNAGGGAISKNYTELPEAVTVNLNPKDKIIICSEGVARIQNQSGELFGHERVLEALLKAPSATVHDIRQEVFFKIEKFAGSNDFPEDLTVLVLEVKESILKIAKN